MAFMKRIQNYLHPNTRDYWDNIYSSEIKAGKIREDRTVLRLIPLLSKKRNILDFGCGVGGNVKLLSQNLRDKNLHLLDYSTIAIDFARNEYLRHQDDRGNRFYYHTELEELSSGDTRFDAVISIEVMEHLEDYSRVLGILWDLLDADGVLAISVPVKGWRDRHREHANKFTVKSMFEILAEYSDWVHISPRTHSVKSGKLATAFFYVAKSSGQATAADERGGRS